MQHSYQPPILIFIGRSKINGNSVLFIIITVNNLTLPTNGPVGIFIGRSNISSSSVFYIILTATLFLPTKALYSSP